MRSTRILTVILALIIFPSCSDNNSGEFSKIRGYYHYNVIDFTTGAIKDSLFACVTISKMDNSNALKVESSILGLLLAKENKLFALWHVDEIGGKFVPQTFTFLDRSLKSKAAWSVEQELGFESGTFERKFEILNDDTSLTISSKKLNGLFLLEQRDWIDIGCMWNVQLFGFDSDSRLIFVHKFVESEPWDELSKRTQKRLYPEETVIHDSKHTYDNVSDYLVLHEFIPDQSISDEEREQWENKNSSYSKQWLHWKTEFEDFIPPPMPKSAPDSTFGYDKL